MNNQLSSNTADKNTKHLNSIIIELFTLLTFHNVGLHVFLSCCLSTYKKFKKNIPAYSNCKLLFSCTEDPYPSSSIDLKCKERVTDSDSENGSGDEGERKVMKLTIKILCKHRFVFICPTHQIKKKEIQSFCLFFFFLRGFLLPLFVPLHYPLHHNISRMAEVSHCHLTRPVGAMMRGDQVGEGVQITGGRKEEKGTVKVHLWVKMEVGCKPPLSPSHLASH